MRRFKEITIIVVVLVFVAILWFTDNPNKAHYLGSLRLDRRYMGKLCDAWSGVTDAPWTGITTLSVVSPVGRAVRNNASQKPKDLRDFLLQPKNSVYQEFGYSEETLLLYNIVSLIEVCQGYDLRIKALEAQLAKPVVDPNEVAK